MASRVPPLGDAATRPARAVMATADPSGRARRFDPAVRATMLAKAVAVGTGIGTAARLARGVHPAFGTALAAFDRSFIPAIRGPVDDAWVARQIARRDAYVRSLATSLGLDPEVAAAAARVQGLPAYLASAGLGHLAL